MTRQRQHCSQCHELLHLQVLGLPPDPPAETVACRQSSSFVNDCLAAARQRFACIWARGCTPAKDLASGDDVP